MPRQKADIHGRIHGSELASRQARNRASRVLDQLADSVRWFKVGLRLFTAAGPAVTVYTHDLGYVRETRALELAGGTCVFNSIDLGMATMSAAEVAGRFHIDNRIMYSIGRACLDLGMFGPKVKQALGIPLSVTGKNPFFDRKA